MSRGWLRAESYVNGAVDLNYVMLLNELIDVEDENERRLMDYNKQNRNAR